MLNVRSARMMFRRIKEQPNSVDEFDSIERTDSEIEKDSEDDCHWNFSQNWSQENCQTHQEVNHKSGNALI